LTNAASVAGKIVLTIRGACGFTLKAANSQAANAIAMVNYNNAGTTAATMGGVDPTIVIPCVSVSLPTGLLLTSTPTAVIALSAGPIPYYNSTPIVAVSKSSAPNSAADFFTYQVVTPLSFAQRRMDYHKHSTNFDTFFLGTRDFDVINSGGTGQFKGGRITALNKINMMNGIGATLRYENFTGATELPMPTQIRMPTTQPNQPTYLWATNNSNAKLSDKIYIYAGTATSLNLLNPYVVKLPRNLSTRNTLLGIQPPPAVPQPLVFASLLANGVVHKNSLWVAQANNVSAIRSVISIMEFDLSNIPTNDTITLRQFIELDAGMEFGLAYPSLDVNINGDLLIQFAISGPNQYVATAFTGRLVTDPLNTIRYPIQIWLPGNYTFLANGQNSSGSNRWLDYTSAMFDPVDQETFYMFSNSPDGRVGVLPNGVATRWTASFGTATINTVPRCSNVQKTQPKSVEINFKKEARYERENPSGFDDGNDEEEEEEPADEVDE
jgi:hypothetical protein